MVSMISAKQRKKLINHTQKFTLIMKKPQHSRKNIGMSLLTNQYISWQEQQIDNILEEYQNVFQELNAVPLHCQVKHSIELVPDSSLPNSYVYIISILENKEICRQIQALINKGHIRPNFSPCGRPVVLVPSKDGTWHMCIDYRDLNKISVKNIYPLPQINELVDNIKGAKFFMKLELKTRYHQIPIESINVWKTTFKTNEG